MEQLRGEWLDRLEELGIGHAIERDEAMLKAEPAGSLPELVPARGAGRHESLRVRLLGVTPAELVPNARSSVDAIAFKAGLLQLHDCQDESHECSQSIEGEGLHRSGDYWHAIMHRREPDYGNAKYWFRRVGPHPVFEPLGKRARTILDDLSSQAAEVWKERLCGRGWDPFAFVDLCQQCASRDDASLEDTARRIQWAEMLLLLEQSYRDARGT